MKVNCGPSRAGKKIWHRWFAWKPTRIGENDCRWLEYIERKGIHWCGGWIWEYRAPGITAIQTRVSTSHD